MRRAGPTVAAVSGSPLDSAMNAPFAIATGSKTSVRNLLVSVRLSDGTEGFGEGAPYYGETQAGELAAVRRAAPRLMGRAAESWRSLLETVDERLGPGHGAARAALGMALLDAWSRRARLPLRTLFGGAETRITTDVTVTLGSPAEAAAEARKIAAFGVRTIKIKVGRDVEADLERVLAVAGVRKGLKIMLDANCGYSPKDSLKLLGLLRRRGLIPVLFEQPAKERDWKGLSDVERLGKVPVAADESVMSREDAWRLAKTKAVSVVNIKLMKRGLLEAWDIALICKAAGVGLMIGGMVESSLAMTAAAHFAAGLGGFSFVDLDTPLWFKKDPMRGLRLARGGVYELDRVKAGIGVSPLP